MSLLTDILTLTAKSVEEADAIHQAHEGEPLGRDTRRLVQARVDARAAIDRARRLVGQAGGRLPVQTAQDCLAEIGRADACRQGQRLWPAEHLDAARKLLNIATQQRDNPRELMHGQMVARLLEAAHASL